MFLFAAPPQFLYQAPPGAQQLTRPDFANVPHFGHIVLLGIVDVKAEELPTVVIRERTISSRSCIGRRVA